VAHALKIGSIDFELLRKPIKNLHISVMPPHGEVRVSAPEQMTDTAIRMAVIKRIPWIKKQKADFKGQARQTAREMVSGETHYLWGKRYRLEVIQRHGKHEIKVCGKSKLQLFISPQTTLENKLKVLDKFYRDEIKTVLPPLLEKWQKQLDVSVADIRIQKMKTKWGSCAIQNRRILLNPELAKKPIECLEYLLVHEMIHFFERKHNKRFESLLDLNIPNWREHKSLLSNTVIAEI